MSKIQKILLVASAISYLTVAVGFLVQLPWLTFLFFMIHSITLLYFTYISFQENRSAEEESLQLKQQISSLENEQTILTERLTASKSMITQLTETLDTRELDLTKLKALLENTEAAKAEAERMVSQSSNNNLLLPPLPENEDAKEAIDLIKIAEDTAKELSSFAAKAGVVIQVSAAIRPLTIKASTSRIRILFKNIMDNSIKYMKKSGSLIITISTVGDDIFIVLKDNGHGLSSTETPHIFELNYQGSNRISGNGLGLTQAKAIVEAYGGTIYAKSSSEKGMGIYIQIPMS